MPNLAIISGFLLCALGGAFFIGTGATAFTALIPTYLGLGIFLCGAAGLTVPTLRMHVMHVAALLGVIGTLGGFAMAIKNSAKLMAGNPPQIEQLAMGILCLVFVALCVRSFIAARRARKAS